VLGIGCLLADTINGLFYRNTINFGFLALECPGVSALFTEGDIAEVDFDTCRITNKTIGQTAEAPPVPEQLRTVLEAGGIHPLLEAEGKIAPLS
jgi:3-isopropylmalate/(R)-2-methylmalate dehydratase small subunit